MTHSLKFHDSTIDRRSAIVPVPHITQEFDWDCGLACSAMVCSYIAPEKYPPLRAYEFVRKHWQSPPFLSSPSSSPSAAQAKGPSVRKEKAPLVVGEEVQSVWTIELLILLQSMLVDPDVGMEMMNYLSAIAGVGDKENMKENKAIDTSSGDIGVKEAVAATTGNASRHRHFRNAPALSMHTTQLGALTSHGNLAFYAERIDDDTKRVQAKFDFVLNHVPTSVGAESGGTMSVRKCKLPKTELINGLQCSDALYIVLVDASRLRCPCNMAAAIISDCCDCCTCRLCCGCCRGTSSGVDHVGDDSDGDVSTASSFLPYQGHFVVACGFDSVNRKILYRNPCRKSGSICSETVSQFETARSAEGTDDDVIVVKLL